MKLSELRTAKGKHSASRKGATGASKGNSKQRQASTRKAKGKRSAEVKLVSSKLAYRGPLFDIYTDYVREPGGIDSRRDVIRHSGSVVILALDGTQNPKDPLVLLEKQYRHAAGRYMWELPAGRKEPAESPLPGARRELMEETGFRAKRWSKLGRFSPSPGFLGEWMDIFVAEGLTQGEAQPDDDEYIECRQIPLSEVLRWIESGKIVDGKTMIGILLYRLRRT